MKPIIPALLVTATIHFTACSKNTVIPVNGSINGVPATSLYGNSNRPTDYILLSRTAVKEISYYGQTFIYRTIPSSTQIFMTVSPTAVMKGTLDTSGSIITMTIDTTTYGGLFASTQYVSK